VDGAEDMNRHTRLLQTKGDFDTQREPQCAHKDVRFVSVSVSAVWLVCVRLDCACGFSRNR
jgi:hypothetical protein